MAISIETVPCIVVVEFLFTSSIMVFIPLWITK